MLTTWIKEPPVALCIKSQTAAMRTFSAGEDLGKPFLLPALIPSLSNLQSCLRFGSSARSEHRHHLDHCSPSSWDGDGRGSSQPTFHRRGAGVGTKFKLTSKHCSYDCSSFPGAMFKDKITCTEVGLCWHLKIKEGRWCVLFLYLFITTENYKELAKPETQWCFRLLTVYFSSQSNIPFN